jgi:hypothetical protein
MKPIPLLHVEIAFDKSRRIKRHVKHGLRSACAPRARFYLKTQQSARLFAPEEVDGAPGLCYDSGRICAKAG